jgi:uncharacterized membrane protein
LSAEKQIMTPDIPYNRKAVDPIECIKAGWELVKPQYWLFVGMAFIGYAIGQAVPLILMGPMMAGFYFVLFAARRREPIEFSTLFKGFEFFGPSLVATLLHMLPVMAIIIPTYLLFYISMFVAVAAQGQDQNPAGVLGVFFTFFLVIIVIFVLILVISVGFTFAYPLIVDRRLSGLDAVKVSFKGAMANFWRLLGMMLLTGIMVTVGMAFCIIGMFLVLPISYAAIAAAYEQVFGLKNPREFAPDLPPPPPVFS